MGTLEDILKDINKKYGTGTVRPANEYPLLTRIPSGIFSLDAEIGGGIPKGRVCIFTGWESTGKTTIAKIIMAKFQKTCRNCLGLVDDCGCDNPTPHKAVLVDVEGSFDKNWFNILGGSVDDLLLIQPQFSEQAVDIVEALVRSGEVDIIVVDSIAMMSPADEIDKSSEDLLVGTHARLINRMMRSVQAGMNSLGMTNERKPSVITINQVRKNVGVMYGNPDTYPGGLGQKFASSITVKFTTRHGEFIYEDGKKKDDSPVGVTVRFKVEKNKTFPPMRSGMFKLYTDDCSYAHKGSINVEEQIADYGVRYGVVQKSGAWFSFDHKGEEKQYQGKQALCNALVEDSAMADAIKNIVMTKILEETEVVISEGIDENEYF